MISVVSKGYRIVSNETALLVARKCCKAAFPEFREDSWKVGRVDAPSTRAHCHFDLVQSSAELEFTGVEAAKRPDRYGLFVRVTNSYDCKYALRIDFGFLRKVCSNGLILAVSVISFRFSHNSRNLEERMRVVASGDAFQKLREKLFGYLEPLNGWGVPVDYFVPITWAALRLGGAAPTSRRRSEHWEDVYERCEELSQSYADDLGDNGYALFNVITDVASKPWGIGLGAVETDPLQRRAGRWLAGVHRELSSGGNPVRESPASLATNGRGRPFADGARTM